MSIDISISYRLRKNGLVMQKPDRYDIPFTVKAQVIKSNEVREGLRYVRTKKVDKSESITQELYRLGEIHPVRPGSLHGSD